MRGEVILLETRSLSKQFPAIVGRRGLRPPPAEYLPARCTPRYPWRRIEVFPGDGAVLSHPRVANFGLLSSHSGLIHSNNFATRFPVVIEWETNPAGTHTRFQRALSSQRNIPAFQHFPTLVPTTGAGCPGSGTNPVRARDRLFPGERDAGLQKISEGVVSNGESVTWLWRAPYPLPAESAALACAPTGRTPAARP